MCEPFVPCLNVGRKFALRSHSKTMETMPKILNPKLLPGNSPQFVLALQSPLYQAAHGTSEVNAPKPSTSSRAKTVGGLRHRNRSCEFEKDQCGPRGGPKGPVRGMRGALVNSMYTTKNGGALFNSLVNSTYTRDNGRSNVDSDWVNVSISMDSPDVSQMHNVPIEVKEVSCAPVQETLKEVKQEVQDEEPLYMEPAKKRARTQEVEEEEEEPSSPGPASKPTKPQQQPEALISEQLREAVEKAQTFVEPNGTEECAPRSRNERHVRFLNCITLVLQESSGFLKSSAESGSFQPSYDELRNFQCNARRLLDEIEQGIHLFRIKEIQRIEAEKARTENAAAVERSKLLSKIDCLRQENEIVKEECFKLEMEVERLSYQKAEAEMMRLEDEADKEKHLKEETKELAKKHEEEVNALGREVVALQGKGICQMCYLNPRDGLVLPCLHLLYCYQCLEKHKLQSKECPWATCRGRINALLLCDLTGENSTS